VAFLYGPTALVGLCAGPRQLALDKTHPEAFLQHHNEREWGVWGDTFITCGQEEEITFVPFNEVGYDQYTVYFPVKQG